MQPLLPPSDPASPPFPAACTQEETQQGNSRQKHTQITNPGFVSIIRNSWEILLLVRVSEMPHPQGIRVHSPCAVDRDGRALPTSRPVDPLKPS